MRKICKLNGIKKILTLFTLLILITVPVGGEPNMISKITVGSNNNSINYPASRNQHVMAYDSESDRIILFGGWDPSKSSSQSFDDTWAYDFNTNSWQNMNPPVKPPDGPFSLTLYLI